LVMISRPMISIDAVSVSISLTNHVLAGC